MLSREFGFPQNLVPEFTSAFHDGAEHLVVVAAREQDFAGVEFEECAADRPDVYAEVVRHAEDYMLLVGWISGCREGDVLISGAL